MEIINFVGFDDARQNAFARFARAFSAPRFRSGGEVAPAVSVRAARPAFFPRAERNAFSVAVLRPAFSPRAFLAGLGRGVGKAISSWKKISAVLLAAFALAVSLAIFFYAQNHTGPLSLKDDGRTELETLDAVMQAFVTDGDALYTESGDIPENEKSAEELEALFKNPVSFQNYTVRAGDTLGGITLRFGLANLSTIIDINGIENARALRVGQQLRIPSIDGMMYTVASGNSLAGLSARFNVPLEDLLDVNDLSDATLFVGQRIFIPGAKMDQTRLHEVLGDLFRNPIRSSYRLTSQFGWRPDPFTGVRTYHTGVDFACAQGTPIYAAMTGTVIAAGWSSVFGNYVVVRHANGYQTLYGHMAEIRAKEGQSVSQQSVLGTVGSTGYSTGNHLHFTVYKNGEPVNPMTVLN